MGWDGAVGLGDGEAVGVDRRVGGLVVKEDKRERSFTVVLFEAGKEKEETEDMEVLRECEREWRCLGPPVDGTPLPSLKFSNRFLAAASSPFTSKEDMREIKNGNPGLEVDKKERKVNRRTRLSRQRRT